MEMLPTLYMEARACFSVYIVALLHWISLPNILQSLYTRHCGSVRNGGPHKSRAQKAEGGGAAAKAKSVHANFAKLWHLTIVLRVQWRFPLKQSSES